MNTSDQPIVRLLERIAVALETIAAIPGGSPLKQVGTPFPWEFMSNRTRQAVQRYRRDKKFQEEFNHAWPWTCEDLLQIGCHTLRNVHMIGEVSINEIDAAMEAAGFKNWKAS